MLTIRCLSSGPIIVGYAGAMLLALLAGSTPAAGPPCPALEPLPLHARGRLGSGLFRAQTKIAAVALSPDGKTLAVVEEDSVVLYEAATGRRLRALARRRPYNVGILAWTDAGRELCLMEDDGASIWRLPSSSRRDVQICYPGSHQAISANGKRFAGGGGGYDTRGPTIIYDLTTGKEISRVVAQYSAFRWSALSPDGSVLATCSGFPVRQSSSRALVQVWDVATPKEKYRFELSTDHTHAACFSPNGKWLVVTTDGAILQLHDAATGKQRWKTKPRWFGGAPNRVFFSGDGKWVSATEQQGCTGLWEASTGKEIKLHKHVVAQRAGAGFLADGRLLAWGLLGNGLETWDPRTGKQRIAAWPHQGAIESLAFTADGKTLLSLDRERFLARWDARTARLVGSQRLRWVAQVSNKGERRMLALDGTAVIVPQRAADPVLIDTRTLRLDTRILKIPGQRQPAGPKQDMRRWLAMAANGSAVGVFLGRQLGGQSRLDLLCSVWRRNGKRITADSRLLGGVDAPGVGWGGGPDAVALSPDGSVVAGIVLGDRRGFGRDPRPESHLLAYDFTRGKAFPVQRAEDLKVVALALAADGRSVVLLAENGQLLAADLVTARPWKQFATCAGVVAGLSAPVGPLFAPDGRTFALASHEQDQGTIRVFEWASRSERARFAVGHARVTALTFSPDSKTLVSGQADSTILLWDLTGESSSPAWKRPTQPAILWQSLHDAGGEKSGQAIQELTARPAVALTLFHQHRSALSLAAPPAARIKKLIAQLDADAHADREAATRELEKWHRLVEPQLRQALSGKPTAEVRLRLERLLARLKEMTRDEVFHVRCVEVLERIGSADAKTLLKQIAAGPVGAILTRDATAALGRLSAK